MMVPLGKPIPDELTDLLKRERVQADERAFHGKMIEAGLRIEVSADGWDSITADRESRDDLYHWWHQNRQTEPFKIMSISVYEVRGLPVPYRIINPFTVK